MACRTFSLVEDWEHQLLQQVQQPISTFDEAVKFTANSQTIDGTMMTGDSLLSMVSNALSTAETATTTAIGEGLMESQPVSLLDTPLNLSVGAAWCCPVRAVGTATTTAIGEGLMESQRVSLLDTPLNRSLGAGKHAKAANRRRRCRRQAKATARLLPETVASIVAVAGVAVPSSASPMKKCPPSKRVRVAVLGERW
eukprot:TRINITY_DN2495_c0_g1_i3.p2 TRINITY_DN2495_c0_g1~~TRINITY_DN2495_c0_g1_i3.p2  ORF type:complete len:197 (-),score=33.41 TRINITY_DN2495_c0_g1_i3:144-734(-)